MSMTENAYSTGSGDTGKGLKGRKKKHAKSEVLDDTPPPRQSPGPWLVVLEPGERQKRGRSKSGLNHLEN